MKLKVGLVFLILAIAMVIGIFYAKDYIMYDSVHAEKAQGQSQTIEAALLAPNNVFTNYSDKVYAKEVFGKVIDRHNQGDIIVLHFWASWCAPCVNEVPEILKYIRNEEHKNFIFLAINLDSTLEDIQKFLKSFPEFDQDPILRIWDKSSFLSKYYDIDKLPATVFLQKDKPMRKKNGVVDWAHLEL